MAKRTYPPDSVEAFIRRHGTPIYGSDPELPGLLVRENPDGSRERGRLIGRRFYVIGPYEALDDLLPGGVPLTFSLRRMQIKNELVVWAVCDTFTALWQFTDAERQALMWSKPEVEDAPLTQSQFERFADFLGIYEALHRLQPSDSAQADFLRRQHDAGEFQGRSPLDIMLGDERGCRRVATWLLSASVGWN